MIPTISLDPTFKNRIRWFFKNLTLKNRRTKILLAGIVLAVFVFQTIFPIQGLFAATPKFNFMEGDYETLRLANSSKGETKWHDPVQAAPSEVVAFNVYYHNGIEDSVAHNTRIKVDLPTAPSLNLVSTAHLSADNAAEIIDTGTVDITGTTEPALLEYIPGTTQWYANQKMTPRPDPVLLPDGITTTGVNIGDITGCWQYAGFVVFQARVIIPGAPNLTLEKLVANSTTDPGTQNWVKQNTANPGDVLAYRLRFLNPGTAVAHNVKVTDNLPANVSYITGTTKLYTNATGPAGQVLPDTVTTSGVSLGDLATGAGASGYIVFQVRVASDLAPGDYTLTNTAKISASDVAEKTDTAVTLIHIQQAEKPDLSIDKKVRNISKNETEFAEQNTAVQGQTLEYKIAFASTGNSQAHNVMIKDVLPNHVSYLAGTTKLNGTQVLPDTITTTGVLLGDLSAGASAYITFQVKIDNCPPVGTFELVNTGKISASDVSEKQDIAKTILTVTPPPEPELSLDKKVANLTAGETTFVDQNAGKPLDILQYRIYFVNTGEGTATGVMVRDFLPANVEFLSGSAILYLGQENIPLSDAIVSVGVSIPDLVHGQDGYITLKAKIKDTVTNGEVLEDTAKIVCAEKKEAQDTAKTLVQIPEKPKPPVITQPEPKVLGKGALPPTGADVAIPFLTSSLITTLYYYARSKKDIVNAIKNKK